MSYNEELAVTTLPIAPFITIQNKSNISLNKDIVFTDVDGNDKVVVSCYGTIIAGRSINYYMDVIYPDVYNTFKEEITAEVNQWGYQLIALATEHAVPIVAISK